uniref:Ultrabithorax n=1 Tax=Trichogramma kaykai TaxID=54128 RepID=A0ABD2VUX7_9HYME
MRDKFCVMTLAFRKHYPAGWRNLQKTMGLRNYEQKFSICGVCAIPRSRENGCVKSLLKTAKIAGLTMNSYFEQSSGFYGSHHHQSSAAAAAQHHDPAAAAAYRSFPLGLGMSPYASSQHHHHSSAASSLGIGHPGSGTNTRPPQDSPYDASVATACKLYSSTPEATAHTTSSYTSTASKDCKQQEQAVAAAAAAHQNGYAAVMAAAAVKDVWQSASAVAASSQSSANNSVVRPSACTPEGSRVGSYSGLVSGDAASSPGNNGSSRSLTSSWNTCGLNSSAASQPVATQLHQQSSANHTFYPWMAIAAPNESIGRSPS